MTASAQPTAEQVPAPLRWPRATKTALPSAVLKRRPEDFRVFEQLHIDFSGDGEHLYLCVEKRGLETREVVKHLASHFRVMAMDVGYAGLKDKWSVARQWFSVPTFDAAAGLSIPGLKVVTSARHNCKLRRGRHEGNRFEIRLRNLAGAEIQVRDTAPNYFGQQRFGTANLDRARAWLHQRRQRQVSRAERGWHLSVLRSYLFNEVLAERVVAGSWCRTLPGDVLLDGKATGPLWGRGRSATGAAAATLENRALAGHRAICEGLEFAGARQSRRALVAAPRDLTVTPEGDGVVIGFTLATGAYATSFLAESFALVEERVP
ncbi:MAG: tRNA pseudouridine(13) synthase TruD [Gammaproteobacteria bacterium]|nr:tRNA pseudouridine(13) synthase TruD [Gammaproteobacteria bacterium]